MPFSVPLTYCFWVLSLFIVQGLDDTEFYRTWIILCPHHIRARVSALSSRWMELKVSWFAWRVLSLSLPWFIPVKLLTWLASSLTLQAEVNKWLGWTSRHRKSIWRRIRKDSFWPFLGNVLGSVLSCFSSYMMFEDIHDVLMKGGHSLTKLQLLLCQTRNISGCSRISFSICLLLLRSRRRKCVAKNWSLYFFSQQDILVLVLFSSLLP